MKKTIIALILLLSFGLLSQTYAAYNPSDGMRLSLEEKSITTIFGAFFGTYKYKDMVPLMAPSLQNDLNELKYNELRETLIKNFGVLKNPKFTLLQKIDNFDRIVYIAQGNNGVLFEVIYVFGLGESSVLLTEFAVRPIPPVSQAPAQQNK